MSDAAGQVYRSSGVRFAINTSLYILVMAPVFSICLMGAKWAYLFGVMALLALPIIFLVSIIISRFDSFLLDDEKRQIIKGRRTIPYDAITRIELNTTGSLLQVNVRQGRKKHSLAYALNSKDLPRLRDQFLKQLSNIPIRERRFVDAKAIFAFTVIIVGIATAAHLYLYRSYPSLNAIPQPLVWEASKGPLKNYTAYANQGFSISTPERFEIFDKDEDSVQLRDWITRDQLKCSLAQVPEMSAAKKLFVRYVSGIQGSYDVLKTAYEARYGIVPLVLKRMALEGLGNVTIREVSLSYSSTPDMKKKKISKQKERESYTSLKGFVVQGQKRGKETALVFLSDPDQRSALEIDFSGPIAKEEALQEQIIRSVRLFITK